MILTSTKLNDKGIVQGAVHEGRRPTTYDATVGSIIRSGVEIKQASFTLKPRHIVWVVSAETFDMGDDTTGLATLKTQWTHQGVLALNVGIVDPGWNGPLAAAVVNLSSSEFVIDLGAPFFRILFHEHAAVPASELKRIAFSRPDYVRQVIGHSKSFSATFLDMDDLSRTVADQVLAMPRWGIILSFIAIVIALLAISIPVGVAVWTDGGSDKAKLGALEIKMTQIEEQLRPKQIDKASCQPAKIGGVDRLVCPVP